MCNKCAQEKKPQIKLEQKRDAENFIDYVEASFQLTPLDEQNRMRELHDDFKKQTYNSQRTSHQDSFCMPIYKHRNGLVSIIEFKCNSKKQDKLLRNYHFTLHLPQQTKHHSSETCYTALKWYSIIFQWLFGMQLIEGGGM